MPHDGEPGHTHSRKKGKTRGSRNPPTTEEGESTPTPSPSVAAANDAITTGNTTFETDKTLVPLELTSLISNDPSDLTKPNYIKVYGSLTSQTQNWTLNWNEETVYGRIDPIPTYSGTTREVSVSFLLLTPVADTGGSQLQMGEYQTATVQRILQMCYPAYANRGDNGFNTAVLKAPPILKIKMGNIISGKDGNSPVVGYLKNVGVEMVNEGLYNMGMSSGNKLVFYSRIQLNMSFGILHDFDLGVDDSGNILKNNYPFNY